MIEQLVDFGGYIFWAWVVLMTLIVTAATSTESTYKWPLFWTIIGVGGVYAFTDAPVPEADPLSVALFATGWLVIGASWAIFKWVRLVSKIRDFRDDYLDAEPMPAAWDLEKNPDMNIEKWRQEQLSSKAYSQFSPNDAASYDGLSLPPVAREFQTRIGNWIIFWPASVIASVIGDIVTPAVEALVGLGGRIARAMSGFMSNLSRRIYEG